MQTSLNENGSPSQKMKQHLLEIKYSISKKEAFPHMRLVIALKEVKGGPTNNPTK